MKLFGVTVGLIADTPKQKSTQWLLWLQGQQLRVVYLTLETNCVHSAKRICYFASVRMRKRGHTVVWLCVFLSVCLLLVYLFP